MNYIENEEYIRKCSDYEDGDEGMGPSVNEYTVYSDSR